jgi:glycosyltransferase involved in cell wall biosynthesis
VKRILFVTQGDQTTASSRHRVYQFLPLLEKAGWDAVISPAMTAAEYRLMSLRPDLLTRTRQYWRVMTRRFRDLHHVREFDRIVIQRPILPSPWPFMEKNFARHKPFIFDYEEAFYLPAGNEANIWGEHRQTQRLSDICQLAKRVTGANEILADFARGHGTEAHVVPMAIDFERAADAVARRQPNPTFTIGWLGSGLTQPSLERVIPILKSLHQRAPFALKIIGGIPEKVTHPFPVEWLPWEMEKENDHLASFDLAIAPIADTPRNRTRTSYRILQYLAHEVPVLASPVGIQVGELKEGEHVLYARTPEDWSDKIVMLMKDEAMRKQLATAGRACVYQNHELNMVFKKFLQVLDAD